MNIHEVAASEATFKSVGKGSKPVSKYWTEQMSLMFCKPILGIVTFFCLSRGIAAVTYRNMSSLAGVHSVAYVTVPTQEVAKKLAQ